MAALSLENTIGDKSPGRLLRRINKLLTKRIETRFADAELVFDEWMSLKLIHDGVVNTAGDLGRDIGIATGPTTRLIDGLEARGLIARDRTSSDRRVVLLKLTEAGRAKYQQKLPVMLASWNEILQDFEEEEVGELIRLLSKLLRSFEEHHEDPMAQ